MSANEGTGATITANATSQPKGFFSLPRELRDEIYDILNYHEVEAGLDQLVFRFRCPPVNTHLINRRFTEEFNMRTSSTDSSQLLVTHKPANLAWVPDKQPHRLPKVPAGMQNMRLTRLEFKVDVADGYRIDGDGLSMLISRIEWIDYVSSLTSRIEWIDYLVRLDPHLVEPRHGGELHLQLFCRYVSNLSLLLDTISHDHRFENLCTKMSLVLHGSQVSTPTMKKLGLHIYSSKPQVLAAWSRTSGWKAEEKIRKQADIEYRGKLDPFEQAETH